MRSNRLDVPVVGVARSADHRATGRTRRASLASMVRGSTGISQLASSFGSVSGDYSDPTTFARWAPRWARRAASVLPGHSSRRFHGRGSSGGGQLRAPAPRRGRKPFGRDPSRRVRSTTRCPRVPDNAIFRIDHYLGKEPVQNILHFRLRTSSSSPSGTAITWRACRLRWPRSRRPAGGVLRRSGRHPRRHSESPPVQIVSYLAMEAPRRADGRHSRGAAKVLHRPATVTQRNRAGAICGIPQRAGRVPDIVGATYAALHLFVDSWRWQGVPFSCAQAVSRIDADRSHRAQPPHGVAEASGKHGNYARFRLSPEVEIAIGARAKQSGEDGRRSRRAGGPQGRERPDRRMNGSWRTQWRATHVLARQDVVEAAWAIVDPVLRLDGPISPYTPGSAGPVEADRLVRRAADGRLRPEHRQFLNSPWALTRDRRSASAGRRFCGFSERGGRAIARAVRFWWRCRARSRRSSTLRWRDSRSTGRASTFWVDERAVPPTMRIRTLPKPIGCG